MDKVSSMGFRDSSQSFFQDAQTMDKYRKIDKIGNKNDQEADDHNAGIDEYLEFIPAAQQGLECDHYDCPPEKIHNQEGD
jgi:hypothetical protein